MQGFTFALSHAVQLMDAAGSQWVGATVCRAGETVWVGCHLQFMILILFYKSYPYYVCTLLFILAGQKSRMLLSYPDSSICQGHPSAETRIRSKL